MCRKGPSLIDGVDIRDLHQQDLRRHVGIVLQDAFLFSGTVASNIRLHEDFSEEHIWRAARLVNADKFIGAAIAGAERRGARARRRPLRGPEAAAHLCAGDGLQPGDLPGAGRGDQFGRHRDGGADPGCHAAS